MSTQRGSLWLLDKLARFGGELLAVDGSKFSAVNARYENFSADKLQNIIARADARLAEYLQQLDTADAAEPGTTTLTKTSLAAKITALQERQDWHKQLLAQDIVLDAGAHVRCTGKGRKSRCVPLRKERVTTLRAWLRERNAQPGDGIKALLPCPGRDAGIRSGQICLGDLEI